MLLADDMVVMADLVDRLQSIVQVMSDVRSRWELKVNRRKTRMIKLQ